VETLNGGENMAKKPKEVKDIKRECCLTCDYLLTCAEVAGAKCRNYKPLEIDQNAVSTRYLELVQKLSETLDELKQVEQEMKIAEMIEKLPKPEEEKPAISKRNKKIKEMIEKSSTVAEIAEELELKQSTVQKEIDYMVKIGVLKATPEGKVALIPA
jgi:hypothetical protein